MSDRDPIPTWWDPAWGVAWPPSTPGPTSGLKRAAPPVSKPNSTSSSTANPQQSALDGTRRVRRRRDSEVNLTERPTAMLEGELSTPAKPTAREAENESCTSGDPLKGINLGKEVKILANLSSALIFVANMMSLYNGGVAHFILTVSNLEE
ncbi:hypothetical protein FRC11_008066 [Ceratobasidium sp. 423]|nr:hypothetical protein FRC11_008066 [Ceratobasidium sp. 423]